MLTANTYNQEVVDNAACEDYGLDIPDTFESCGSEECPYWFKGDWSLCHQSRCFARNTAIQKREVSCRFANNSIAAACHEYEKPISRQECYNERCRGVWRVEPWSEVKTKCYNFSFVEIWFWCLSLFACSFVCLVSLLFNCSAMRLVVARALNIVYCNAFGTALEGRQETLANTKTGQQLWKFARVLRAMQKVNIK